MSEHDEQVALFEWAALSTGRYPDLEALYAIPNGGKRHLSVGKYLKAEGTKAGVPDVHLPVARAGYYSLYIEMKYGKNKPTDDQANWLRFLDRKGHAIAVCWDFHAAQEIIEWYLDQPPTAVIRSGTEDPMPEVGRKWSP